MPTYGYRCSSCGHQFEIHQSFSDAPLQECPKCAGKLTKVFYPAGVIFKGSGFYTTDYKAKPSESNGSTSSDKKPDSKPESKSDSKD
ncbi:MAG TPA: FmdB family zinc ribbon protein [Candidatus Dormibacteraeota bacterium]|nr:FmdB family zinc ribbon protein [Candidatus Dormibacteraeota bacterium]